MSNVQNTTLLISIAGGDSVGVVASVSGYLFEIGANLADTAYAVLGRGYEFSCVVTFDNVTTVEELQSGLQSLEILSGARMTVTPFPFDLDRDDTGSISHIIEVSAGDRPGLVACVSEVLGDFNANIVRMNSRRVESADGSMQYRTRFAVSIGPSQAVKCKNALANMAGSMRLKLTVEEIG